LKDGTMITSTTNDARPAGCTLASTLTAQLREAILDGRMAPGEKLHLDELRTSYGVSLSPLREALSRLGAEGLVQMEDQRGYRVAPVSEANCREVIRLRAEMESLALAESMRLGDDEWEASVVAAFHRLSKYDNPAQRKANLPEWERLHRAFHLSLMSACAMPLLLQFCSSLHDLSDRYRRLFIAKHVADKNVPNEHKTIMEAALARDQKKATGLLREHIERTGQRNVLPMVVAAQAQAARAADRG